MADEKNLNSLIKAYLFQKSGNLFNIMGISTDTRSIKPLDLFVPLVGENFDGHDYIEAALNAGAVAALSMKDSDDERVIKVDDTLVAYQEIASLYRHALNPLVIGITGSAGKTTAKELMKAVLSEKFKVHATEKNFNNEIGVPKTILEMPASAEVLILEMGMRGLGQIELLSHIAKPNIALITNIGTAHIELLGSRENIKKAKYEIKKGLCAHDAYEATPQFLVSDASTDEKHEIKGLKSQGIKESMYLVTQVAEFLGMNDDEIQAGFDNYEPGPGRGKFIEDRKGNLFIDETYNSNPEAVLNSVEALISDFPDKKRIVVLGDIKESQDDLINECFAKVEAMDLELLDARDLPIKKIDSRLNKLLDGNSVVLVKASREAKLERLLGSHF